MQMDTWLKGNKLYLNVARTNCMLIATQQNHSYLINRNKNLNLAIRNTELEMIRNNKYLGVAIDNSLNWKVHIKSVSAKASKSIGFLRHAKAFLPQQTLKRLSTGIVELHFRYCYSAWDCGKNFSMGLLKV